MMNAFEKIREGLEEALTISDHKYWAVGVFRTKKGREYNRLLFSSNDLAEVERKADEFAHSPELTLKPDMILVHKG